MYRLQELGIECHRARGGGCVPEGRYLESTIPVRAVDSESYTYGYSFSKELLDEWEWSDTLPASRGRCAT